jgi:large subunit ribosomal protein L1
VDKTGIIHTSVGKVSFDADKIYENAKELIDTLNRLKPSASKGVYFQSITVSSTMSPGIKVDTKALTV